MSLEAKFDSFADRLKEDITEIKTDLRDIKETKLPEIHQKIMDHELKIHSAATAVTGAAMNLTACQEERDSLFQDIKDRLAIHFRLIMLILGSGGIGALIIAYLEMKA